MIPKIIHQIWIGPYPRPEHWMRTWPEMNPSFRYELWDNDRCAAFGFENADKIDESPEWCGKADLMRYEILARHGGIFIDADAECVRPLDDFMLNNDCFACCENEVARPELISNGYLGAVPNNLLMRMLMDAAKYRNMSAARAWITSGPMFLTHMVRFSGYPIHIYPSHYFIPKHYTGVEYKGDGPVYARQHWGSTLGYKASGA